MTCFRAHPSTLGNILMCNHQDPALLHALSAGSEDSQALGTLWIYSSSSLPGEILCLLGFTQHSHLPVTLLRASFSSVPTSFNSTTWLQIIHHPVLSEPKRDKKQVNCQFPPITQITQLCHIFFLQSLPIPDIPPFVLTPQSRGCEVICEKGQGFL